MDRYEVSVVSWQNTSGDIMDPSDWLQRWREWLEGDLFQEVHELVRQREVFKSWNEIAEVASPESKTRGLFHAWVNHNYIDSLAMGVRRAQSTGRP